MTALDDQMLVAGQIGPGDVAELSAQGISLIINNRPDGEDPDQPAGAEIEAAAAAAGIAYRHIPVAGSIDARSIQATAEALDGAEGKVLAFCRSGTRSTYLWALAQASRGADVDELAARAAAAGYDLSPLRPYLARTPGSAAPPRGRPRGPSGGSE